MEELSVRAACQAMHAYNSRVQKLTRVQEKLQSKPDQMVTLRNALKLYQNYKAMESCCEALAVCVDNVAQRLGDNVGGDGDGGDELVVGRVLEEYLVLRVDPDGTYHDHPHGHSTATVCHSYPADQVTLFCRLPNNNHNAVHGEFRAKHPVLALYPGTNRMLPAQVSSPPSRRRKTMDYLVKFPGDPASVPCPSRFVIDPATLH